MSSGTATVEWQPAPPVRRLPVVALLVANLISQSGNTIAMLAVPWFVLETTGSAGETGITLFFTSLPVVLAGFFGGTLVDRLGQKPMSILADLASGVTVALIPLMHATVGLAFWQLLALVFLGALLDAPGVTARRALLPDLATLAQMPLERANAASQAIARGSRLAGAPLAGLMITAFGAGAALWVNAASFAVSAVIVALLVPSIRLPMQEGGRYLSQLAGGLRFIRSDRLILALVISVAVTNFIDAPLGVVFPVFAREVYDSAAALGLMFAGNGVGALLGSVCYGAYGHRLSRRLTFIGCFIAAGGAFGALVLLPPLAVTVLVLTFAGIAAAPLNPVLDTVFQERVPPELRGRVFGTITALAWIAMPLGALAGGALLEVVGLRATVALVAAAYLIATVSMLFVRALRAMDRAPDPATIVPQKSSSSVGG